MTGNIAFAWSQPVILCTHVDGKYMEYFKTQVFSFVKLPSYTLLCHFKIFHLPHHHPHNLSFGPIIQRKPVSIEPVVVLFQRIALIFNIFTHKTNFGFFYFSCRFRPIGIKMFKNSLRTSASTLDFWHMSERGQCYCYERDLGIVVSIYLEKFFMQYSFWKDRTPLE